MSGERCGPVTAASPAPPAGAVGDVDGDGPTELLPVHERHLVLVEWARGRTVAREPVTVLDLIQQQVARTADAPAVRVGGTTLTYRELDHRSDHVARHVIEAGTPEDAPVGVCLRRTVDLLPALLGVWKASRSYLPFDVDVPAQRMRRMAATAGCALVVSHSDQADVLTALDGVRTLLLDRAIDPAGPGPVDLSAARPGPHDLAYVMFTSGSTGVPKGVLVEHGGLTNYLLWAAEEYGARGAGGSPYFTSIGFDLGVPSLFVPLLMGQAVHLLPDPLDPADLGALLVAGGPYGFVKMTPGHLNLISLDLTADEARDLAGVVIAAGDAFPRGLAARWRSLAGPDGTAVATEYGPTEITIGNSGARIDRDGDGGLVPLGTPIPNTTMYVLTEWLEPVPPGVPGEIYVGGVGVARGYLSDPALTARRFVPDPYGAPGSRLYRTGDRARWRAGDLEFLGRTDHQLKIRGHRVELAEIDAALQRQPGVRDAVVVDRHRDGRVELAGFVVPEAGRTVHPAGLRAALAGELPDYMIPSRLRVADELPLTANGKVDRRALHDLLDGDSRPPDARSAATPTEGAEDAVYQVVVNHEEQYSLWSADRRPPAGWQPAGFVGRRDDCLTHIATVWTDMRPLGARCPVTAGPGSAR